MNSRNQKNSKTFKVKLKKTKSLVYSSIQKSQSPVVACSFGKNSMVVLDLAREVDPSIKVLFNDTLMEYPDTYEFKKFICEKWKLHIIETIPSRTFWWVVDKYGFPLFSRKGNADATKNCCRHLKEYPIEKILRKYKFDLYFTGLSRHESRLREFSAKKYGNYFYSKRNKHWKCHPIQDWTEGDVWLYHKMKNLPYNSFYDKPSPQEFNMRTGCWCCTIPIKYGKIEFLRINYPRLWKVLLKKGVGDLIIKNKTNFKANPSQVKDLMETDPCFFDRL